MKPSCNLLAPSPRPSPPLRAGERVPKGRERNYVLSTDEFPPPFDPMIPPTISLRRLAARAITLSILAATLALRAADPAPGKSVSVTSDLDEAKARLIIDALLSGAAGDRDRLIHTAAIEHSVQVTSRNIRHVIQVTLEILHGDAKEIPLVLLGNGDITSVTGEGLLDWSVRRDAAGGRALVLRPKPGDKPPPRLTMNIIGERELPAVAGNEPLLAISTAQPALVSGYLKIESSPDILVQTVDPSGLAPMEAKFLPAAMQGEMKSNPAEPLAFRFQGSAYGISVALTLADPESRGVVLRNFDLVGEMAQGTASFTLSAIARVRNTQGGTIPLLNGGVALTDIEVPAECRVRFEDGQYVLATTKDGEFPLKVRFKALVKAAEGWSSVDFRIAPSAVQPIVLKGLGQDTQFQFAGAARPERKGIDYLSHLPPDGAVKLAWKEARTEAEGKLFYAAEMLSQVSVSPGLMRAVSLLQFKVMQGELGSMELLISGAGEVTRVQGDHVLAWRVEPASSTETRRLLVQFNQPQKDAFSILVQVQLPLGTFPQAVDVPRLQPTDATRFAGHVRVVNEGAVRLEVVKSSGLSQVAPEQFPESDVTKAAMPVAGTQRFVFRFSGTDVALRLQADNILPEVAVSQVLAYHLAEAEQDIDAELELDIREAPVRELLIRVPRGFSLAKLNAAGMSDFFLREPEGETNAEVRLVYGQPVTGRQIVQMRLERNQPLGDTNWVLPRIELVKSKSTRGHIGISSDAGFRLTPERTQGLTEIATAFFPRKTAGMQAAFRLNDAAWQATMRVERLPQSVQADAFHLFSIGEGIAYGSSVINYLVAGAPVTSFRVELSAEYFNVEFTGRDVRNWQKTDGGYVVQLHTPVAGAFTLLATYERPFQPKGETLTFTGVRPIDAQTEQGYTVVISTFQFQVKPVTVSAGLLPLQSAEVPAEYRLLFDAPILAAYRYSARPFNLQLALSPLLQGETLGQVADRASIRTRISKEGQVLTDASYFVKNRGQPHFRVTLPAGTELWSALVNGVAAVPVTDAGAHLIPLPQKGDANAILRVDLKLAARPADARRVRVAAPIVAAPVMLAEWKLEPDTGQRLAFRRGSLTPVGGVPDISGFVGLMKLVRNLDTVRGLGGFALLALGLVVWRWNSGAGVHRFTLRHILGAVVGLVAVCLATFTFAEVFRIARTFHATLPVDMTLLAPVQQAGSALSIEVDNLPLVASTFTSISHAWPIILAVLAWVYAWTRPPGWARVRDRVVGWAICSWTALVWPNGVPGFLAVIFAFLLLELVLPAFHRVWSVQPRPQAPVPPSTPEAGAAPAVTALLIAGWLLSGSTTAEAAAENRLPGKAIAATVTQTVRIDDKFAFAETKLTWSAIKGQLLPVIYEPAVLTDMVYPNNSLKLVDAPVGNRRARQLLALESGTFEITLRYQASVNPPGVQRPEGESGFVLPIHPGLINRLELTLLNLDVDVLSAQAVAIERTAAGTNTVASLVLAPVPDAWIGWRPRSRDVRREKAVFYAEVTQLYVPAPGVIEGLHAVSIRPAQGELTDLTFEIPPGATITDVTDDATPPTSPLWRFDPDTRKLRVTLTPARSKPFTLVIRSQIPTGPLPVQQAIGVVTTAQAAGEIGLLGIATGSEVQLDDVNSSSLAPINLEDFPAAAAAMLQARVPGITVRRAFRYGDGKASATLKASAVEPDVRVESQDTLSLGEDRTVLAANMAVDITRAGVFRLSFVLPQGLDVEAISGEAMSHWTELKTDAGRVITLHLKGRTEGQQAFNITLAGAGVKAAKAWAVPQLLLREAGKQRGTLVVVPEQGMRLQVATRDGLTQLDPQKSGIRQKGVLAFRVLQTPWNLSLDLELVDPWIQVTSLQQVEVSEALVKINANLQYQIENTGLKALRVLMSTNAESVRFTGDQVADFMPVAGTSNGGMQEWEIKLHRRVIGRYQLQVACQTLLAPGAVETSVRGIQAAGVNLQRGFVTVQATGRLQVGADALPPALQPAEWQSVPRALQTDPQATTAQHTFRLVEPAFTLPLKLQRHEAAQLLPARVNQITFKSVIADDGAMLTQVILSILPGDKRLLHVTLPKDARFWFAFVDQNGVLPWREQDRVLIPLDPPSQPGQPVSVEVFYSSRAGGTGGRSFDARLVAPKFDLPLENIRWQVYLNEKWRLRSWAGTLQLEEQVEVVRPEVVDVQTYLKSEASLQEAKTKSAEQLLATGNRLLESGDPQQARRAFQAAFGLSQHDNAFNEDARVQLHNLKLQQAVVGLNARQVAIEGETGALGGKLRELRNRKDLAYTQQDAKEIFGRNNADDNAAFMKLAERLIQQQDAAVAAPTAIRASIPEQGRLLTFARTVQVDTASELRVELRTTLVRAASGILRLVVIAAVCAGLFGLAWAGSKLRVPRAM